MVPETLNIAELFLDRRLEEGLGDRPALHLPDGPMTYQEVHERAERYARILRRRGVRREERVFIALPDGADFVAALFGTLKLGAVVVMLNPRLKSDEIAAQLDYTRARLLVVDAEGESAFRPLCEGSPWIESGLLVVDGQGSDSFAAGSAEVEAETDPVVTAETHRDDPAIWLYSGGTTGRPKAVVQSHRSFAVTTELYGQKTLGYGPDDITLSVPKLYFGYATGANLFFPFSVGGSAVLFPDFPTPEVLFEKIASYRPTILINVPTLVQRMVESAEAADRDLSCLRFATSAGEALPTVLYERWKQTFGVELLDGLGTAEMWHVFITNRVDDVKPGTLGRVVDGFEIEARDQDDQPVPTGEVGRLWVRGDARAMGYWQNMDKSRVAFRGEWFVSSDLIRIDERGYVTFCGRGDDAMKVGGRWLVPKEVEDVLNRHPSVEECAVVGAEDRAGLMKPFAFVLATEDRDPSALAEELKTRALNELQAYKHPREVFVVSTLPRTHLGKIDRGALKRRLVDELQAGFPKGDP